MLDNRVTPIEVLRSQEVMLARRASPRRLTWHCSGRIYPGLRLATPSLAQRKAPLNSVLGGWVNAPEYTDEPHVGKHSTNA